MRIRLIWFIHEWGKYSQCSHTVFSCCPLSLSALAIFSRSPLSTIWRHTSTNDWYYIILACPVSLYPICVQSEAGPRFTRPVGRMEGWQVSLILYYYTKIIHQLSFSSCLITQWNSSWPSIIIIHKIIILVQTCMYPTNIDMKYPCSWWPALHIYSCLSICC